MEPETESGVPSEGWTWLHNATKWHYFREGRSLCLKWALFHATEGYDTSDKESPDNCKDCWRRRQKEVARVQP